jgi:protein-disulfide isomerase
MIRRALAALAAVSTLAVAPARAELMSTATPTPDEPPVQTRSGKVAVSRDPALPPAYGPPRTKVHVIVFSDFQCPVCARITAATHQIAEEWPGDVRLEFRQLPLANHADAENAAVAALAAHRQGKFWAMHDVLFAHQQDLAPTSLARWARQAGCDEQRFAADYADPKLRERVRREAALPALLGVQSTPAFLVNGKVSVGWASWGAFRGEVEREREAVNALLAKGTSLREVHARRAREALKDDRAYRAYRTAVIDPLAKPR